MNVKHKHHIFNFGTKKKIDKNLLSRRKRAIAITRKMVPITGRAHSLYFWSFQKLYRGGETEQQTYHFIYGHNILLRLQVHHLTLFIIHNKHNMNTIFIYIHTSYELF